ncbi:hypothetical protein JAAARDRAFT_33189 [Jaapia argillacea MUCL 33604]|uniref:Uncharacterized protein n=1 Tax=Jaapia argillacea MUCL 33604 TaxID=933084 RepID=A0A067PXQ4_9AGAM|nr:hypothetical protein JAAARDRAFT_33189 [Jaapia argillacea MUCL 33604]
MQLASHGARGLKGFHAPPIFSGGTPAPRSIHIPAFHPRPQPSFSTQRLISQARTFVSTFVKHLTTPGTIRAPPSAALSLSRSFNLAASQGKTIQHGFSTPVRHALVNPSLRGAPCLPKAPAVPRFVTQVGLGTARNFHSGRPIFDNLVQNVPIAGRAFVEADWGLKLKEEQNKMKMAAQKSKGKETRKTKEMMKAKEPKVKVQKEEIIEQELEHYFPSPAVPEVTTVLLVPIAPTPTSRMPLSISGSPSRLLPFDTIASIHASHETHSLRVSSLFTRLDQGKVWDRGAKCSAYGDPSGLCTVLKIEFVGWTQGMVRGIIGESGSGWCEIEEIRPKTKAEEEDETESVLSELSSLEESSTVDGSEVGYGRDPWGSPPASDIFGSTIEPSDSFVLPTLDFSSHFYATTRQSVSPPYASLPFASPPASPPAPSLQFADNDRWSDSDSDSDDSDNLSVGSSGGLSDMSSGSWVDYPTSPRSPMSNISPMSPRRPPSPGYVGSPMGSGWMAFSSNFAARMEEDPEPRMEAFW